MKKNIFIIVNAVLAAAVIGLYILYFCCNNGSNTLPPIVKSNEVGTVEDGIVYIQIDSLVQNYDMFHDLKFELEKKAEKIRKDLDNKGKAFEFKVKDFQEKMQKGLLTRSQAEQQQNQLEQEQANLQQYAQRVQNEMAEEEAVMFRRIFDAIQTFLVEYNQVHHYALILSTSGSTNAILQGAPELDITQDVLNGLNARYKK